MSFLLRLATRALGDGGMPLLQPKDRGLGRVYRPIAARAAEPAPAEEPEDPPAEAAAGEAAAPARRTPLRRQDAGEEVVEEVEDAPATTDATLAPLHRAEAEPAEAEAPAEPPDETPAQPLRRARDPAPEDPPREDMPKPEGLAEEPPPSDARALRREAAPMAGGTISTGTGFVIGEAGMADLGAPAAEAPSFAAMAGEPAPPSVTVRPPERQVAAGPFWLAPPAEAPMRPQVVVEQVDVLIHEPVPEAAPDRSARMRARAFDARYLRRL